MYGPDVVNHPPIRGPEQTLLPFCCACVLQTSLLRMTQESCCPQLPTGNGGRHDAIGATSTRQTKLGPGAWGSFACDLASNEDSQPSHQRKSASQSSKSVRQVPPFRDPEPGLGRDSDPALPCAGPLALGMEAATEPSGGACGLRDK